MTKRIAEVVYGDPERKEMNWVLDADGILYLSGQGRIPECINEKNIPWRDKRHLIRCVRVAAGVTELGVNAFKDCINLVKVVLPDSVKRIHVGCFYNCRNLVEIQMNGEAEFRFTYEPNDEGGEKGDTIKRKIIFGLRSFYGVPWFIHKMGDFYIRDGVLYSCFTTGPHIIIPKEVHTIERFAFSGTDIESVYFHKDVANIEMFAFANTKLRSVRLPAGLKYLAPYAFAGAPLGSAEFTHEGDPTISELCFAKSGLSYDPDGYLLPDCYELVLRSAGKNLPEYKLFKIHKKDPREEVTKKQIVISNLLKKTLNVGWSFYKRMQKESAIIGICVDEEKKRVLNVRSYVLSAEDNMPQEYLMYPCYEDKEMSEVGIWNDYITKITPEQLQEMFHARVISKEVERDTDLRKLMPGVHEYWYQTKDNGNFGGAMEIPFLKQWMASHPDYCVSTKDENQEKDPYREFIPF